MNLLKKICDKLGFSFDFLNRYNSPSNKAVIKDSSVGSLQQATGDIHNTTIVNNRGSQTRPRIDIVEYGGSGGADGTSVSLKLKNDGGEAAIDVLVEFTADDLQGGGNFNVASLSPGEPSRSINYQYNDTDFFKRKLQNPRIIFKYKSVDGRSFVSGRTICQELRADGRYNIHQKLGTYFESELGENFKIEIEKISFNRGVTTQEGLAESFSLTIPLLIKNLSDDKIMIRNIKPTLELPDGYKWYMSYDSINSPNGRDIVGKNFLPCTFVFGVNIKGREKGVNDQNPEYVSNKDKILSEISSAKIRFRLTVEVVSLDGTRTMENFFDITDVLLPQMKK